MINADGRTSKQLSIKSSKAKQITDAFNAEEDVQETLPDDGQIRFTSEMRMMKDVFLEVGNEMDVQNQQMYKLTVSYEKMEEQLHLFE